MAEFIVTLEFANGSEDMAVRVAAPTADEAADRAWAWADQNIEDDRVEATSALTLAEADAHYGAGTADAVTERI